MGGRDFTEPRPSALGASQDVRWPQELLVRRAAIDAALEGLAAYEFGPGQGHACGSTGASGTKASRPGVVPSIPDNGLP
jgi:hypothetical protein